MTAPACPISHSQIPYDVAIKVGAGAAPGNGSGALQAAPKFQAIPPAMDLPTLIRTVNVMRSVLRQLLINTTVNNVYNPPPTFFRATGNTYYNEFPAWTQIAVLNMSGYVYHHEWKNRDDPKDTDRNQRALVRRINAIDFQNNQQEAPDFYWKYYLPFDQQLGTPEEAGT